MKLLDVLTSYDGIDAELVLMSSYTFDPVFFESRLLRSRALAQARRTVVLVDAGEWERTLQLDKPARWLNYRYLVVPIRTATGVFHPKLALMLGSDQCRLLCGSGNLTQAGYAYNLELHNRFTFDIDDESPPSRNQLIAGGYEFFRNAISQSDSIEAGLARNWLDEAATSWGFTNRRPPDNADSVRLVHTLRGGLWPLLESAWNERPPEELLVMSPFFDADHQLLARLKQRWPKCKLRIIAQQRTSLLDARKAEKVFPGVRIESLDFKGRRLHAKLLAWRVGEIWECVVGSANFTSAAMDGRNVEACLWVRAASEMIDALFDDDLRPTRIAAGDFIAGETLAPEDAVQPESKALRITSALLDEFGAISISYQSMLEPSPEEIVVAFRGANDMLPAWTASVSPRSNGRVSFRIPENCPLSLAGAIRVSLIGELSGSRIESLPVWLIQESKLTHEASSEGGTDRQRVVRETGKGLPEYLDELAKAAGAATVIEYLESLNIPFFDGQGWGRTRKFVLTHHDPYRPDVPPDWLLSLPPDKRSSLARAIIEFADRHERGRILRHARRGNINGVENFLDILLCVTRMLFIYYRRGVLQQQDVLERLKRYVSLATIGTESQNPNDPGYLAMLAANLKGDKATLKNRCEEANAAAILRVVLLLTQYVRCSNPEGVAGEGITSVLKIWKDKLVSALRSASLKYPTPEQTANILRELGVLSDVEVVEWSRWLSNETVPEQSPVRR